MEQTGQRKIAVRSSYQEGAGSDGPLPALRRALGCGADASEGLCASVALQKVGTPATRHSQAGRFLSSLSGLLPPSRASEPKARCPEMDKQTRQLEDSRRCVKETTFVQTP